MDTDRSIRHLIPPIFFLFLIFWALVTEPCRNHLNSLLNHIGSFSSTDGLVKIIGLIIGGSSLIIAIGYIISQFTIFIINILKFFGFNIEAIMSEKIYDHLRSLLFQNEKKRTLKDFDFFVYNDNEKTKNNVFPNNNHEKYDEYRKKQFYAASLFDHWIIKSYAPGIHEWLLRRANHFYVSAHCVSAIILSLAPIYYYQIPISSDFVIPVSILFVVFLTNSIIARKELHRLFQYIITEDINLDMKGLFCRLKNKVLYFLQYF